MTFNNPLNPSLSSLPDLFVAILNMVIIVSTPIVVFFLIFSGFKYVMARGNPEQIQEASKSLTYGVIGGVIILASVAILEIVKNVVSAF